LNAEVEEDSFPDSAVAEDTISPLQLFIFLGMKYADHLEPTFDKRFKTLCILFRQFDQNLEELIEAL
jgi:hypothetical protein